MDRIRNKGGWLDQLPQVVFQLDEFHQWAFLSGGWTSITGWSPAQSLGIPITQFIHPQDRGQWEEHLKAAGRGAHQPDVARLRVLTREGKYRWVEIRLRTLSNGLHEHTLGTLADITDQVQAEDLRQAEYQNLVGLVHRLPALLYRGRNNRDWTMYFTSEGAYKLTGYSAQEIVNNRAITYGSLIHPEDRDKVWNEVQAALRERRAFEILYRIITAQGHVKWVWERGQGVFSKGEDLLGIEGFITEAPQRLKRFTDRAEQASLYDASHGYPTQGLLLDRVDCIIRTTEEDPRAGFVFLLLGLANGDDLLTHIGQEGFEELRHQILERLRENLGNTASLAVLNHLRIGILISEPREPREVGALIDRIRLRCQNGYRVGGKRADLDLNIGIAMSQSGWTSSEEVLESADQAMVHAGAIGGTREMSTDQRLQGEMVSFARLAQALPEALQRGDLRLELQPVYHSPEETPAAWYASLVWPQKRKGPVHLREILPAARNRDLVPQLKECLYGELARHREEWAGEFLKDPEHRILLRLDAPELLDPDLLERCMDLAGIDGGRILPAVPEGLLATPSGAEEGAALARLLERRQTGLVLDDFT
ncbi:MAG TPA: PAS domain-containing protein, partial [Gammaproteobacteria bacterium]|nr:PAS domain-containing protein [Gammaproteobacteria bacterium]